LAPTPKTLIAVFVALVLGPLGCMSCFATPAPDAAPSHQCCTQTGKCGTGQLPKADNTDCHLQPVNAAKSSDSSVRLISAEPVAAISPTLPVQPHYRLSESSDAGHSPPPLLLSSVLRI
jgi:hypothetical protein